MKPVIVGTAGHIDHGKTALVKALTGMDADRLQEEKRRGITIDIGFAHLELPAPEPYHVELGEAASTLRIGFVDVPGHERFVRNMLAGIGGIDLVLLIVAADEGIMPQTREHFDICRLLSIRRGFTVITKSDLVDSESLAVVRLEVEEYLRGSFLDAAHAPIVPVSSTTGAGLDVLRRELARMAATVPARDSASPLRLPIDRVFTMKGFGTVVTGTLLSGTVQKEQEVEILPQQRRARVRGVQVYGAAAERANAGERTAVNLAGVATEELARGMALAAPGLLRPTSRADVELNLLPSARNLKDRARVHLHAHTAETVAEVVLLDGAKSLRPGSTAFAQLRLQDPMLLLPGDRFILRQFSPVVTIGGGRVLDAAPLPRQRRNDVRLDTLRTFGAEAPQDVLHARVARRGRHGLSVEDAAAETGWLRAWVEAVEAELARQGRIAVLGNMLISAEALAAAKQAAMDAVNAFHQKDPLVAGIAKEELRERLRLAVPIFTGVIYELVNEGKLGLAGEQVCAAGRQVVMADEESAAKQAIEHAFGDAGLQVPALKDVLARLPVDRSRAQKIVTLLLRERVLVKLADDLVFHREALDGLRKQVSGYKQKSPKIDVAGFKDLTGISRKYAIPLLEWLDQQRVTRRVGNERVIL